MNPGLSTLVRNAAQLANLSELFSSQEKKRLQKTLVQASLALDAGEYLSLSLTASLATLFLFVPLALISSFDPLNALAFSLLAFAAVFFLLKSLPARVAKKRATELDNELSIALRAIHASLQFNAPFEKSISLVAQGGFGELSKEFSKVLADVRHGTAVQTALLQFTQRVNSVNAKRAAMQLCFAYEHGLKGEGLRKLADELAQSQRSQSRQFAAKTAISGLLFIAASSIIPAFFSAYSAVGSLFLNTQVAPTDVYLAFLLVFPLANAGILQYIKSQAPPGFSMAAKQVSRPELGAELEKMGVKIPFEKAMAITAIFSTLAASLELLFLFPTPSASDALFAALTAILPPLLLYFCLDYARSQKTRELENNLPHALFQLASFPKRTPMEKMVSSIAEGDFGELSSEFKKIHGRISAGQSVSGALHASAKTASSPIYSRAIKLLHEGYESGADLSDALRTLAEDTLETHSIAQENASAMAMQKYTILTGACIIVPAVLAMLLSLVATLSLDFAPTNEEGDFSTTKPAPQELLGAFEFSMQAYLAIFSATAAIFAAFTENAPKKAAMYFALILPLALFAFNAARAIF